jgi:hypothetical protein
LRPRVFPVDRWSGVSFDFRAEPGTRVDLYFRLGSRPCRIRLTGPESGPEGVDTLGRAGGVADDGRWHAVRVDFSRFDPSGRAFVQGLTIGNRSNAGLLLGGGSGNRQGAGYELRNVRLLPGEPRPGK